jgi:phenylacetic acid degradation operon negative regulatory protein
VNIPRYYDSLVTAVKKLKSQVESRYAGLDLAVPSTPANSFITDIGVWFVRERGNCLRTATWVRLLGALEIAAPSARTALHRMMKAGYLQREPSNGRPGYSMSPAWIEYIRKVTDEAREPDESDDNWVLLTFSIPETRRAQRHVIRTLLGRNGFAPLGNGVWIASRTRLPAVRVAIESSELAQFVDVFEAEYEGFADLSAFVRRCWDIDAINAMYGRFIQDVSRWLKDAPTTDVGSFRNVVLTANAWRRINFTDPALPGRALPADWPRAEAMRLREELLGRFIAPARGYVDSLEGS